MLNSADMFAADPAVCRSYSVQILLVVLSLAVRLLLTSRCSVNADGTFTTSSDAFESLPTVQMVLTASVTSDADSQR